MSGREVTKKRRVERSPVVDPSTSTDPYIKLLEEQENCDVFFVVGSKREKIGAHKVILKARSTYFEALFSERWAGSRSNPVEERKEIVPQDDYPSLFRSFLERMYAPISSIPPAEAVKFSSLAKYYGVESRMKSYTELLEKTLQPDDLLQVFETARKYGKSEMVSKAWRTMADYFPQLVKSSTFETVTEATLIYLLKRPDLNVSESELFSILLRWADKQIETLVEDPKPLRKEVLKNLIPLVRFPAMPNNEFIKIVMPADVLPLETTCDILVMHLTRDKEEREAITIRIPFSAVRRNNNLMCVDLYKAKSRRGRGTYPNVALQKRSNVSDVLTFRFQDNLGHPKPRIVSLVLMAPNYGDPLLFQNSSEVAALNLPISVAVSLSLVYKNCKLIWTSEEVVTEIGKEQKILTLENPWFLTRSSISQPPTYKITTRFLSDVYAVPDVVSAASQDPTNRRNENFDFFTSTKLKDSAGNEYGEYWGISLGDLSMSRGTRSKSPRKIMSSGLHLIRSIQFRF